jgi:hypothetical protein
VSYFDGCYFDPAYFDASVCVPPVTTGGGRPIPRYPVPVTPDRVAERFYANRTKTEYEREQARARQRIEAIVRVNLRKYLHEIDDEEALLALEDI